MTDVSCRQKIKLTRPYTLAETLPLSPSDFDCSNLTEAILLSLFLMDNQYGNTMNEIVAKVQSICPDFTVEEIETEVFSDLKSGILNSLRPICINYCGDVPYPEIRYTFGPYMDAKPLHKPYVTFLIRLAGGQQTAIFRKLFIQYLFPIFPITG